MADVRTAIGALEADPQAVDPALRTQIRRGTWRRAARLVHGWMAQVADPLRAWRGLRGLGWYSADLLSYRQLPDAEPIQWRELAPALHERSTSHELDAHYFYLNAWATRRICAQRPPGHVDVGSQISFGSMLSAVLPVIYVDYRPLAVQLPNFGSLGGSLLELPFRSDSLISLSCLHVAEHVGLGRYGDPLDPAGTRKSAVELERTLAPGGRLYFALPVGRPRVCFNAHRVHAARTILEFFPALQLIDFAGVDDAGVFRENLRVTALDHCEFACGMFCFTKRRAS